MFVRYFVWKSPYKIIQENQYEQYRDFCVKIYAKPKDVLEMKQMIKKIHFLEEENAPSYEHLKKLKSKLLLLIIDEKSKKWIDKNM